MLATHTLGYSNLNYQGIFSSPPLHPKEGDFYYDSTKRETMIYTQQNGWMPLSQPLSQQSPMPYTPLPYSPPTTNNPYVAANDYATMPLVPYDIKNPYDTIDACKKLIHLHNAKVFDSQQAMSILNMLLAEDTETVTLATTILDNAEKSIDEDVVNELKKKFNIDDRKEG